MFIFSYLTLKARLNDSPPSFFRKIIALYAFNTAATEVLVPLPGWWVATFCTYAQFLIQWLSVSSALYACNGSLPKYMSGGGVVTSQSQASCVGAAQTLSVP